ncbi:MAG: N-acetylmuramoyl-L-alanine amidase, partial [Calditrichaeota bacterium]|nr:N-acetylmuramoyl-L-alanine amidase [Calditrichota bacterium]
IDPGHGGIDSGAVGYLSKRNPLYEKTVVLDIGLKIKTLLNKKVPNVKIVMTRDTDDTVKLFHRGTIANKNKAKLFISLHCNGNRSSRANGFETYVLGTHKDEAAREVALAENEVIKYEDEETSSAYTGLNLIRATMAQSAYKKESIYLARIIDNKVGSHMKTLDIKNRGVKSAGFAVLFKPSMPSVLVEVAFITNKHEVKVLARKNDRSRIAESIAGGVLQYIKDVEALNG